MKYDIIRVKAGSDELEGETVATGLTTPEFEDTDVEPGKRYEYIIEAYTDDGQYQDRNVVFAKTVGEPEPEPDLPTTNIFVSNKPLTWASLPAYDQSNNGSLRLLSQETRENVPVVNEDYALSRKSFKERLKEISEMPDKPLEKEVVEPVTYETRTVYTYEADFEWDKRFMTLDEIDPNKPNIDWSNYKPVDWLVDVLQFKNNRLRSGFAAFDGFLGESMTALPDLDTSNLIDMSWMFSETQAFDQPLDNFDTSNVVNMGFMFAETLSFNQSLENFDTSNVVNMSGMFCSAIAFDQPLDNFDTSNVVSMMGMFINARGFNRPLNHFDTSKVIHVGYMFASARAFNQPLDKWDTSSVASILYMEAMFYTASTFNQDISNWCVEKIPNKPDSFDILSGFRGQTAKQPQWGQAC